MSHRRAMGVPDLAGDSNGAGLRPPVTPLPPPTAVAQRIFNDKNGLHRCAIALCSNPAVAEGVCAMHLSRSGPPATEAMPRSSVHDSMAPGAFGAYGNAPLEANEAQRFYKASSQAAMQPRGAPNSKKQRTTLDVERFGPMGSMSSSANGSSMALTRENINQMVERMKYAKSSGTHGMSAYSEHVMMSSQRPSVSTPSGNSESEASMDADRETNLRRERNRIAARKSRQRKLDRISNLEEEKQRLEQHRDMLVQEIRSLENKETGRSSASSMTITDEEYVKLQEKRTRIIKEVEDAFNSGNIGSTLKYMRDDSIVSGPQNSSVHLRGQDALVLDYLCTTYLFGDIHLQHTKIDSGGPRSQHFRVHWLFSGSIKEPGVSMNKEFLQLIQSVRGKRVTIEGVSNFSFSGDKIVYVHRTADQAKFLSALVKLSRK